MTLRIALYAASLAALIGAPASAQPDAREAFEAGDFANARNLAAAASDAASKTVAAEARLAFLEIGDPARDMPPAEDRIERRDAAREAAELASEALELDPDHAPARLALAEALRVEAHHTEAVSAALDRLPQRRKEEIERAIALDPSDPRAWAALGEWHLDIVRRAGERTFDASVETGLERARAAAATATGPGVPYRIALQLLALDAELYADEAVDLLRRASEADTSGVYDERLRDRARALLDIAQTFRPAAAEEAKRRLDGADGVDNI